MNSIKKILLIFALILSTLACNFGRQINSPTKELPTEVPRLLESTPTSPLENVVWEVIPSVEVLSNPNLWLLQPETENGNEVTPARLLSLNVNGCFLQLNYGRGFPGNWSVVEENIFLGEWTVVRKQFLDGNGYLQFTVYYFDSVDIFLQAPEDWQSCAMEAEKVLATLHIVTIP
jgi:hypothetical protein